MENAITEAVADAGEVKVSLIKQEWGLQLAVVTARTEVTKKILEQGWLLVSRVSCRTCIWHDVKRCFKCLALGHESRDYGGPDSSLCCRKCGTAGHKVKECNELEDLCMAFRWTLREETLAREEVSKAMQ